MKSHILATCVLTILCACSSSDSKKDEDAPKTASLELAEKFEADAKEGRWGDINKDLDVFMRQCVLDGREAWGHAVFQELKPVWRMQTGGGYKYVTSVQNMADVLRIGAQRSVEKDRAAWRRGDMKRLRDSLTDEHSYTDPEVRKHLEDPLAADFLAVIVKTQDLIAKKDVAVQDATDWAARCDQVAAGLDNAGRAEDSLLLRIAGAEVLDAAGQSDQALDRWLEVSSAPALGKADAVLQVAVARRIKSFRDRLRDELSSSISKEEQARADAAIAAAKQESAKLTDEERAKVAKLEDDISALSARSKVEKEEAVAQQTQLSAETIDRQAQRIAALEDNLVKLAMARSESHSQIDWNVRTQTIPPDVLGAWQQSQAGAADPKTPADPKKPEEPKKE